MDFPLDLRRKPRGAFLRNVVGVEVDQRIVDRADPMQYVELRGFATIEEDPDRSFLRSTFVAAGMEPPENLDPPGTERGIVRIHPQQSSSPFLYGDRFHPKQVIPPEAGRGSILATR